MTFNYESGKCQPCKENCQICDIGFYTYEGTWTIELCYQCVPGLYLYNNHDCIETCPAGTYADDVLGWCVKCDCNCETCSSRFQCTSCHGHDSMFEIIDGRCYHDPYLKPEARISDDLMSVEIDIPKFVFFEEESFIG